MEWELQLVKIQMQNYLVIKYLFTPTQIKEAQDTIETLPKNADIAEKAESGANREPPAQT